MNTFKNITDIADYKGLLFITNEPAGNEYFNSFCFTIEREILKGIDYTDYGLLGTEVYNDLIADLDSNNEPQTATFINLVDGVTWTDTGGNERNFIGIRELLTYFVYAEYIKRNMYFQTGVGTVILTPKNATQADIKRLSREAHLRWNRGVEIYNGEAYDYLLNYQSSFSNWNFTKQTKYILNAVI